MLADCRCDVLAGHIRRSGGGGLIDGADAMLGLLNELWDRPIAWREKGRRGQDYVRRQYGSRSALAATLTEAVQQLRRPLAECMSRRGIERAARFERSVWREQFAGLVEQGLDGPVRQMRPQLDIVPRTTSRTVRLD